MTEQMKNDERDGQEQEAQLDAELEADITTDEELEATGDVEESDDEAPGNEEPVAVGAREANGRRAKAPSKQTLAREERRRRSEARKARRKLLYGIGGGFIAAALILGLVLPSTGNLANPSSNSESAQGATPSVGTPQPIQAASVIESGAAHDAYETSPPTSGPRFAEGVEWGVYDSQQPMEAIVRNLEEGGVVVHHNLSDPAQIDDLRTFIEAQPGYPGCFVMQPYGLDPGVVTITSWGWVDSYDAVDRAALQGFIEDHRNVGPLFLGNTCGADTVLPAGAPVEHDAGL
ncbi:MAG: DUF3105 domain-containing protein [Chloroflexi bacterium]|nr:DUF3105 domain-containing protein [Chloroflexota bacterium]